MNEQPSTSSFPSDTLLNHPYEATKQDVTNAVHYFVNILKENNIILETVTTPTSARSKLIAEELFHRFMQMDNEMLFIDSDELIHENEIVTEGCSLDVEEGASSSTTTSPDKSSTPSEPASPVSKRGKYLPATFDEKLRAVSMAKLHPSWSLKSLQKGGCYRLKRKDQLSRWKNEIEKGGTYFDKCAQIDKWAKDRFVEAREAYSSVSTRTIQQWAMAAAMQHLSDDFNFTASRSWAIRFKNKHKIKQRQVTKYVSRREVVSLEKIKETAEIFQSQTKQIVASFPPDLVINTDQTGCEYRVNIRRTLSHQGEKVTQVAVGSIHKVTHSYTAQYSITKSGKLLPIVFPCLQEPNGTFGPRVYENVQDLSKLFKNVYVTCTKSGKLTVAKYNEYLDNVVIPYVQNNRFCLIVDSWTGQTDTTVYDQKFIDENKQPTCTIKVIPPHCTPLCQPCDVYFYRQVKIFIGRLQNAPILLQQKRELHNREDAIKIHSLIQNQLSAPIFSDMLAYAWYASKLSDKRSIFLNVLQVNFTHRIIQQKCTCGIQAFVRCAWCFKYICFECFYDRYHPSNCDELPNL